MEKKSGQKGFLTRAFSHADDRRARPLHDVLDLKFGSIEVDVWLVNGELRLGHDWEIAVNGPLLEDVYLKPLLDRVQKNKGSVYPGQPGTPLHLMMDIKSQSGESYDALHRLLEKYKNMLTTFTDDGKVSESAVTVTVSGNRAWHKLRSQPLRYAGLDGRMNDLSQHTSSLVPVISDDWTDYFAWNGQGEMPEKERQRLHEIVKAAHDNDQRCRFWNTPDSDPQKREAVWRELVAAGVDYINTDHPEALSRWLVANDPQPSAPGIRQSFNINNITNIRSAPAAIVNPRREIPRLWHKQVMRKLKGKKL